MSYVMNQNQINSIFAQMSSLQYKSDVVIAEFTTDAEYIDSVLPHYFDRPSSPKAYLAFLNESVGFTTYIGASLNIAARFQDLDGWYHLSMMYNTEFAVTVGREVLGECKKLADVRMDTDAHSVSGSTTRNGTELMNFRAQIADEIPSEEYLTRLFDIQAHLSHDARRIVGNPTMLVKERRSTAEQTFRLNDGSIELQSSLVDPCGSIPIRSLDSMTYYIGRSTQESIREVELADAEQFYPYFLARNFDLKVLLDS